MNISYKGYSSNMLTFKAGTVTQEYPIKLSDSDTVENCDSGNDFIGIAISEKNGIAGVQTDGYVELPYTSTAPTVGWCGLVADGSGGVKTSTSAAKKYKVLTVDTQNATVGFIL